jgi:hypothetical protein
MSTTLQLIGAAAITVGGLLISLPIGLIVAGVFAILIGLSLGK